MPWTTNPSAPLDLAEMTMERGSRELPGYELGINASTVASHLSSAMKKLGARTRVDLNRIATRRHPG